MTVEIEIIDRVYYNIEDFCKVNGFDIKEYMSNAITERYNLDKYGDLNEKLVKKEEKKPSTRRTKKEEPIVEVKPVEVTAEQKIEEVKIEKPVEEVKTVVTGTIKVEPIIEEKPKRTRRTLKTK